MYIRRTKQKEQGLKKYIRTKNYVKKVKNQK